MTHHRPSRWLAPLALLVALVAVMYVYANSTGDDGGGDGGSPASEEQREAQGGRTGTAAGTQTGGRTSTQRQRRRYTVRPGDTLAVIAERTGVSVERLQELNPDIDPNSLTVGDKIKLTE